MYVTPLRSGVDHDALQKKSPVLFIGNFLSASLGIRGVCEDLAAQLKQSGWAVITASNKPGRLARLLDMITTVLKNRHRYSIANVEVYSGWAFFWAALVSRILHSIHKPYILTLHGGNLPTFAKRWPRPMTRLLRSAAGVTTPSRYLYEAMISYRADIHLLPNSLDLSCYRFTLRERPQPSLVWLRSFHTIYNPQLAPRTVARLSNDFPNIHLTMVGPDRGDQSLAATRQVATMLGVGNRIDVVGGVPKAEVPNVLSKADIFLNTTNFDNTPVSVLEAMACGLVIVSTNVGGIPHLLENEYDALLVPPNDPVMMAAAVRRVLTEPDLAKRLSRNARTKVEQFGWSAILPKWEKLFTTTCAR